MSSILIHDFIDNNFQWFFTHNYILYKQKSFKFDFELNLNIISVAFLDRIKKKN